ncbi:MAG: NADH-quinone oxidoreductase subunit L [Acidobacteriota bacterium]|nr:NADH-quinone oxidoreductase subunit L [Acidobacteriota bacterium]
MRNLWLIPAFPLAGFLLNGVFGRKLPKSAVTLIAILSVLLSFAWVLKFVFTAGDLNVAYTERYFTWIRSGEFQVGWDFTADRLTAVMLLVVTGVGSLIHIYSAGYMAQDSSYPRFFAYLNLFMFFMLTLVLAANYLLLFIGWEGVGLASYLLVGFWYQKRSATDAGNKAFIVNRIGDFGFTLAMLLIVVHFGTLDFGTVFAAAPGKAAVTLTAICFLILVGACGKSAQFPLYVWLPDAMEGPTPVSALIHAATMVTAGIYVIARSSVLFTHAPIAMEAVAYIGLFTAIFSASIGLVQNDIKKIFAYSTVSQLGYMFLGLGVGAFSAGIYHLMTHAFFKALLFLGAGSVIHACGGEQDIRKMGGLRAKVPLTFATLICAGLAISGIPPFSGYFSKDAILIAAYHHAPWMFWIGVITAGMTAFYVFRALFITFFGSYRGTAHPHESPPSMTGPLVILALLSLGGGFFAVPRYLDPMFPSGEEGHATGLVIISVVAGAIGILIAGAMYLGRPRPGKEPGALYTLVYNKYYVDEVYDAVLVKPLITTSRSVLWKLVDNALIDGIVNAFATQSRNTGNALSRLQSGNIRNYAAWVVLGSVVLILVMGLRGAGR